MKLQLFLYFVFLLILSTNNVLGQHHGFGFQQISPPGGFSQRGISSIVQDNTGYIWIAPRDRYGIIRYDSNNMTRFEPANDSVSIPRCIILDLHVDVHNNLRVASENGLYQFNRENQSFTKVEYTYEDGSKSDMAMRAIINDEQNQLYILESHCFGYFDPEQNQLHRIKSISGKHLSSIHKTINNQILIGTYHGDVYQFNPSNKHLKKIISGSGSVITTICTDNNRIWLGYRSNGIEVFNTTGELLKNYTLNSSKTDNENKGIIRKIKKDTYGRIWIGAYEGLFMDNGQELINVNSNDYPKLPHNSIFEIYEDSQGGLWIGTWAGGVALIHHSLNNFSTYRHNDSPNSLSNNLVSCFVQTNSNEILVGTEEGGLNSFNLTTKKFKSLPFSGYHFIKNIKSLCRDKFGGIWIGTYLDGLWYKKAGNLSFKQFKQGNEDGKHINWNSVYALCAADSGVWIGTIGDELNFYDFQSETIRYGLPGFEKSELPEGQVRSMLFDSQSNLWLCTFKGIHRIHLPSKKITNIETTHYADDPLKNMVYHIYELSNGEIWMGTKNKGIIVFDPKTETYSNFDVNGILKGKDVFGIIEDKKNRVWLTSNIGLVVYNPQNRVGRLLDYSDGIQSNLFNPRAIYSDDKDNLYLGGTNGFSCIRYTDLRSNLKEPGTTIREVITKNNKIVLPTHSTNYKTDQIVLSPKENTLRINFFADNYLIPKKNKFTYRLQNYDNTWIKTDNGSAIFQSLKPGDYIFEVKACNNDGVWNNIPTQMPIIIKNFWYRTTFTYAIYFLLLFSILFSIGRFYFDRLQLKRDIDIEKSQRENEKQVHEMKLKFFTNISHEFRTPLTLISWPLNKLINSKNITDEERRELEIVQRNSNRLLQLINQIVDLRKIEKGKSKLTITKIDIIKVVKEMQQNFSSEAKRNEIEVLIDSPYSSLAIEVDSEKLDSIIYNLLSNAYKYVSKGGKVRISVNTEISKNDKIYTNQLSFGEINGEDFVEITIEDTGLGIDSEDLLLIFNRFEQGKQEKNNSTEKIKGSGIGLSVCKEYTLLHQGKITAQSTKDKGTCFTITLPTKQKAQKLLYESHSEYKNLKAPEIKQAKPNQNKKLEEINQILVVEDNSDFRSFLCNYLNQYYMVLHASNGNEALSLLKKHDISLIVSDVMMPQMDGFEFCSIVKTQIETSHIPIILLTALSSPENLIAGLDKGADAYLTKPFNENALLKQIENMLEQRIRLQNKFKNEFVSENTVEAGALDNYFLKRVSAIIEENISNENFGMDILAKELKISRTHLFRKIKSLSGGTASEFVNLVRIKKAVELIKTGDWLLNEVAFKVGFSSQPYFNKCFKKVYNKSPKEYFRQKSNQKNKL